MELRSKSARSESGICIGVDSVTPQHLTDYLLLERAPTDEIPTDARSLSTLVSHIVSIKNIGWLAFSALESLRVTLTRCRIRSGIMRSAFQVLGECLQTEYSVLQTVGEISSTHHHASPTYIRVVSSIAAAQQDLDSEYEYEDEPAPAPAPVTKKPIISPALRGRSLPIQPSRNNKIPQAPLKSSKPSKPVEPEAPPQPPPEEEEEQGEEGEEAAPANPEPPTEPPKRTIKPVVRPFRSNDDLLAALKRRRVQAQEKGTVVDRTTSAPASATESSAKAKALNKSNNNKRNRVAPSPTTPPQEAAPRRAPPPPPRKAPSRAARPAPAAQNSAPDEEAQNSQEVAARSKFSRGSRRL